MKRPLVGLAMIPPGKHFSCAGCDHYHKESTNIGTCDHPDKALDGRTVSGDWCCDYFICPGMIVIEE
jgi:hypothetical protein